MAFMFGVLGSFIFWTAFFMVGFVIGSLILRWIAPRTFEFITTGQKHRHLLWGEITIILLVVYLFWPVIVFILLIGLIFKAVLWPTFCRGVKASANIIPEFEIKKKESKENKTVKRKGG